MKSLRYFVPVLALALVAIALGVQVPLKRGYKVGDQWTWRLNMDISLWGESANYNSLVTEKVIRVEEDGTYEIETTQSAYKATFAEQGVDIADTDLPVSKTVYAKSGEVKELKGTITNDAAYRLANMTAVRMPDKAVAVGESWTSAVAANKSTGVLPATVTYKVEAEEKIGDFECIRCQFSFKETEGADPMTSEGQVWINKADGTMVNMKASWTNAPIPGAGSLISGTVTYTRETPPPPVGG